MSIGEAASLVGLSVDAVRYYEKQGLTLTAVARGADGWRRYDRHDLAWLAGLVMLRGTGMSIQQMRDFAAAYRADEDEHRRLELLERHRVSVVERLAEVQRHLGALDAKIAAYRAALGEVLDEVPVAERSAVP